MNRGNIVNILQDLSTNFFDKKILYYYKLEKDKLIQHSLSFKELDDISSSLAFYLQESGIKRGDRILIFIPVT